MSVCGDLAQFPRSSSCSLSRAWRTPPTPRPASDQPIAEQTAALAAVNPAATGDSIRAVVTGLRQTIVDNGLSQALTQASDWVKELELSWTAHREGQTAFGINTGDDANSGLDTRSASAALAAKAAGFSAHPYAIDLGLVTFGTGGAESEVWQLGHAQPLAALITDQQYHRARFRGSRPDQQQRRSRQQPRPSAWRARADPAVACHGRRRSLLVGRTRLRPKGRRHARRLEAEPRRECRDRRRPRRGYPRQWRLRRRALSFAAGSVEVVFSKDFLFFVMAGPAPAIHVFVALKTRRCPEQVRA